MQGMCRSFISPSNFPRGEFKTNLVTMSLGMNTLSCRHAVTGTSLEGRNVQGKVKQAGV